MSKFEVSRRGFIEGGLGLTVANFLPGSAPLRTLRRWKSRPSRPRRRPVRRTSTV